MDRTTDRFGFLEDLQNRVMALLQQTPAADMQKNLKALLTQQFAKMDLVTRDEFDTQTQVLARTREKLERLERRLAQLEGSAEASPGGAPAASPMHSDQAAGQ
jgi:BMFP domain-containing protein YqiC